VWLAASDPGCFGRYRALQRRCPHILLVLQADGPGGDSVSTADLLRAAGRRCGPWIMPHRRAGRCFVCNAGGGCSLLNDRVQTLVIPTWSDADRFRLLCSWGAMADPLEVAQIHERAAEARAPVHCRRSHCSRSPPQIAPLCMAFRPGQRGMPFCTHR
jgi:hypothetical protein